MASQRTRRILPLAVVLGAVLIAFVLIKLRPTPPKQQPRVPRPLVEVATVADTVPHVRVESFGSVTAKRSIDIVPQVSGAVVEKAAVFEHGAFFAADDVLLRIDDSDSDDVLLRIDDTDYVLAVQWGEAEVARARYNQATADEEAEVARREWEQMRGNEGPDSEFPDTPSALVLREPQLALAQADLAAARASLRQAQVNLDRCTIRAPFAGRTLSDNVDEGQYVRAGTMVGSIYATDVAEIIVSIPDADLAWIPVPRSPGDGREGAEVVIRAEYAGAEHRWTGRAVRLGGAVNLHSRLVPVVIEVTEPYALVGERPPLVEGMFVETIFTGEAPAGAVAIPRGALRPGNKVWVVTADETITIRDVTVARAGVEQAILTAGLAAGEEVCVSNLQYVTEGMLVRVAGRPTAEAADRAGENDAAEPDGDTNDTGTIATARGGQS